MKHLLSFLALASCTPAYAAPIDDAKYLMCRHKTTAALTTLGADGQNYIWARDQFVACASPATPLPVPVPTPTPTPTPAPEPSGVAIAGQSALKAALAGAKGGETFILADVSYGKLALADRRWATPVTIRGGRFEAYSTLTRVSGLTLDGSMIRGEAGMVDGAYGLKLDAVDGITLLNMRSEGVGQGGFGIYTRTGGSKNIRIVGGYSKGWKNAFTFAGVNGLTIESHRFTEMGADGAQIGASSNITIRNNVFRDWSTARGSHGDGIQFTFANDNVRVEGNDIEIAAQGISAHNPYAMTNTRYIGNRVKVLYARALWINLGVRSAINDNQLFTWPGSTNKPMIGAGGDVKVFGNTRDGAPYP